MNLKDLEHDIELMEKTIKKMESLNKEVVDMDHQVDGVRQDLIEELHTLEKNADRKP